MKSHLLDMAPYLGEISRYVIYALAVLEILRGIRWFLHRLKKEVAPITPRTRREAARYFTALVSVLTIAFGLVVLLAVSLLKAPWLSPALVVVAGVIAALGLLGQLLQVFGLPAYEYTMGLEERCRQLEHRDRVREERLRAIELEIHSVRRILEEQFPTQQKLDFTNSMVSAATRDEYTS